MKIDSACVPSPSSASGAGSHTPSDPAATGAQVPKAPVALCCDCRAPMSPLEVTLYKFSCRRCAGNS